ncbi:MAG TPA: RagB/SusD family nutrient uptake outer membrane protein, partial [Niastella sp.]|nr:RagB/SusD family nutrient uptake outer membrane protein [Niastella sp.]
MYLFRLINKWGVAAIFVIGLLPVTSCNKLLDPGAPANKVTTPQVYASDSLAQAALIGVYIKIMESFGPLNGYMSRFAGLAADELNRTSTSDVDQPFLTNVISPEDKTIRYIWTTFYSYIYQCNDLAEGLTTPNNITPALRSQLLGEAYFLRALCYFYLVVLYGDVPLALNTDYTKNATKHRTPATEVYDQMIEDLNAAQSLLADKYFTTTDSSARVRANRLAAKALLARIYLYHEQWANAAAEATAVI